ncbi:MAG TPA: glycosyltransferase family 39 protein [Solirubrobacteraceae bacterium]|jgi:4-amino-4-deoxy-L-arabinose transferase-like glycosyltransferase|nr:glycosyltransferase family 39 protein [Solirubrobacteraceae bacterium]
MSAADRTTALNATETPMPAVSAPAPAAPAGAQATVRQRSLRPSLERVRPRYAALAGILAFSAILNTHRLSQNGYANTFYSAGVHSMLKSWHNFFFVSFDGSGLVTIDKPPLGVWTQAASAKLFGFSPLSLLLPEAIVSTIAVAVLYRIVARRLGTGAGLAAALALAVFPSFVAVSRENGVDPLLLLLTILACGSALNAIEDGRWRWLIASALLVGFAFNTKTLAAYLIVPGIALAYLVCAPGRWYRQIGMLAVAGLVMGVASFAWIAAVELTPASQRPYVGSSTNNTELGLTFEYNGLGRVEGEVGGPGKIPIAEGGLVRTRLVHHHHPYRHLSGAQRAALAAAARQEHERRERVLKAARSTYLPNGRLRDAIAFGGETSPMRLFEDRLADQGSWTLPFAILGMLALALLLLVSERKRRSPRLAFLIVFGGWLLVEVAILSLSKGIVHPYYISAVAPGAAAMIGAGAFALTRFAKQRSWGVLLLPCAVGATVAAQIAVLDYQHYLRWYIPFLIVGAGVLVVAMAVRRIAAPAMGLLVCLLLFAPAAYATTTWLAPVEGTFPAAGPRQAAGEGGVGLNAIDLRIYRNLVRYVDTHGPGSRWSVLTVAAPTAAPMILLGSPAGALAGYSGTDPVLDAPGLAHLVAKGEARYVVLGGAYASRGGNLATKAVLHVCRLVPYRAWHGPHPSTYELALFDCAGRERALEAQARVKVAKVRLVDFSRPLPLS